MSIETTIYNVEIELLEDLLGTVPKQKAVYAEYIASKAPTEEDAAQEVESVEDLEKLEARGWTGFHLDTKGNPMLYNYAIKGFLCEAARTIRQFGAMKQLQDKFKRFTFVYPREIPLVKTPKNGLNVLERPLRAMTAQGPRVCLARSDVIPAGTKIKFQIEVLDSSGITRSCLETVLEYGRFMGLGQWRSGGHGSFKLLKLEEE